jgi:hypothetical protein
MTWILILIVFFSGAIIALIQIIKINRIMLKYGANIFSKAKNMTSVDGKTILKAFLIALSALIGAFLIIGLVIYLQSPKNFHIYY